MKIIRLIRRCLYIIVFLNIIDAIAQFRQLHTLSQWMVQLIAIWAALCIFYVLLPAPEKQFLWTIRNNILGKKSTLLVLKHKKLTSGYEDSHPHLVAHTYTDDATHEKIVAAESQLQQLQDRIQSMNAYRNQLSKQINDLNQTYQMLQDLTSKHDELVAEVKQLQEKKQHLTDAKISKDYQEYRNYKSKSILEKVDEYDGYQFERFTCQLLENLGFTQVQITHGSGDYGVDVYAINGDTSYVFQCKLYSTPVGIKAVQEANSGRSFYDSKKAVVVTNNYFTPHAITASKKLDVDLWNRDKLADLIAESDT